MGEGVEAEELLLGILGHSSGRTEAEEVDPPALGQTVDGPLQACPVQAVFEKGEAVGGGVQDLEGHGFDGVAAFDREGHRATFGDQLLGELQLETLETVEADGAAKTDDGGLADVGLRRQIDNPHVDHVLWVCKYILGNLLLGLAKLTFELLELVQDEYVVHSRIPVKPWLGTINQARRRA